ncbi:MAG: hypothetical protein CMJ98_13825 [Planctomycetes bacterium]|nr:hypothetical protein [Planctomycetota bacterium]MCP4243824.1 PAS domain S-box protein [bacterium]MDP6075551.1 PAS domain S-box protein [Myxococcota bacterium]MDP6242392.1 PAS domain S-box protein [Myxococcota bacterium]MDP7076505.1 PAS domain S-box protein [Myxococcota bacterium]
MAEFLLCLILLAVGGLVWSLRDATNPAVLWTWGWLVIGAVSAFMFFAKNVPWVHVPAQLLSPLLPAFLLAGALAYADRRVPTWLLPAGLAFGAVRWSLGRVSPEMSHILSTLAEPAVELAGAYLVFQVARSPGVMPSQKLLPVTFVAVAVLDGATSLAYFWQGAIHNSMALAWPAVALITLGFQVTAAGHHTRKRRSDLEHESQKARQALQESEQRFAVLAQHTGDAIFELDGDWHVKYMSDSVHHILGFGAAQYTAKSAGDGIHPDDRQRVLQTMATILKTSDACTVRARCAHRDGSWRWLEATMHAFRNEAGDLRLVGVARDVTESHEQQQSLRRDRDTLEHRVEDRTTQLVEAIRDLEREVVGRRLAEEELRASREQYRAVSELSSDFSYGFQLMPDRSSEIEWATEAFTRLTGYTSNEIQEKGWSVLCDSAHMVAAAEQIEAALAGKTVEFEGNITTKSGETRWIHTCLIAERGEGDDVIRVVGASRDVTERKHAEEERRRLEAHLGEVQRLESLGVLAGGIAHDFNNLLSVILGNSSLALADPAPDPETHRRFSRIRSAAKHAAGLTDQMLTYSGMTPFSLKPTDLSGVVRNTVELLEASIPQQNVLELNLSNDLPPIEGDDTQLRQVVVNLVTNAAEALDDRSGKVRVKTGWTKITEDIFPIGTPKASSGTYVFLEVEDSGSGIDEATRERIFEPFFTTRIAGRGLGLAAVLGIVQGHRGVITLESAPGKGTSFRVLFPCSEAHPTVSKPKPEVVRRANAVHPAKVLIIDDEESVLEIGVEFLQRAGFRVIAASGGREGIAAVASQGDEIDVVILDLMMPDLDGEETLREIHRLYPNLPVILTSGYSEERSKQRFSAEHIAGFLGKPYEPTDLIEKVEKALGTESTRDA